MTRSLRAVHQTRAGRRTRCGLALALAALGLASPLRADEIAWDNTSGSFLWSTPANWSADTLPAATDTLLFTDTGAGTINLGGLTRTIAGLTLAPDTAAYTFSNGTLQLPSITQTAGSATLNTALKAPSGLTLDVQANTLSLLGAVTATGLTKTGDGTVLIGGTTSAITGTTNLNAGKLLLTAANAFSGGIVQLAGGTLELQSTGATAGTYNVTANSALIVSRASGSGGSSTIPSLTLGDSTLSISTLNSHTFQANALTVNGTGSATIRNDGTITLSKTTLNGDLTLTGAGGGTVRLFAGSGNLALNGTGTYNVVCDTVNTFSGAMTVNPGATASAKLDDRMPARVILAGGTLSYARAYGPAEVTVIANSTLHVADGSLRVSRLSLTGPTLSLTNANSGVFTALALDVSAPTTLFNELRNTTTGMTVNAATLDHALTMTGHGFLSLTRMSGPGDLIMNGVGALQIIGTKDNGSRDWSGNLVINSGRLMLKEDILHESFARSTQPVIIKSGAALNLDYLTPEPDLDFTRPLHLSGPGYADPVGLGALSIGHYRPSVLTLASPITLTGSTTISVWAGTPTPAWLNIGRPDAPASGTAALDGAGALVKTGAGTLQINVPAGYTEGTTVKSGALIVGPNGSLVNTGPTTVNFGGTLGVSKPAGDNPALHSVNPSSVSLKGSSLLLMADLEPTQFLAADSTGGNILIGSLPGSPSVECTHDLNLSRLVSGVPGSAWRLGSAYAGGRYSGTISFDAPETLRFDGSGALTVTSPLRATNNIAGISVGGSGNAILEGDNDYAGETVVTTGKLTVSGDRSVGTSTSPIRLTGSAGELILRESATLSRDIAIEGIGTKYITGSNAVHTGAVSLGANLEAGAPAGSTLTLSGPISGDGGLSTDKRSSTGGTVILSGENTYSGPTYVWKVMLDASTTPNRTLGSSKSITIDDGGVLRVRSPESHDPAAVFKLLTRGAIGVASNAVPPIDASSVGIFGIDIEGFDAITDLSLLGNGNMRLSSTSSGSFTGLTLAPNVPNAYGDRKYLLGGGGGTLVLVNPVLANYDGRTHLEVGRSGLPRESGTVVLHGDNTYSGTTNIDVGALEAGDAGRVLGDSMSINIGMEGRLRLLASTNYKPGAIFHLWDDSAIIAVAGKFLPTMWGTGVFAIDTEGFDLITNLSNLVEGDSFCSSTTTGTLSPPTLEPGKGNVYRFGRGGGRLTVLTDLADAPGTPRSLQIGFAATKPDTSVTVLAGRNAYTGGTNVISGTLLVSGAITGTATVGASSTLGFLASQDLNDLLVDETATDAKAILHPGVEVRIYSDSFDDGTAPSRTTLERLWTDISTGFGQGKSGIDLDPSIDRNTYALGLLMATDARNEPHALIKALLRGDIDGSGAVDEADALVMLASFSQPAESATSFTWIEGDLTYDGLLNEFDVGELARAMDYPFDPAAGLAPAMDALRSMANVPEPAALLLLPLALLTLTRRRLRS